MFLVSSFLHSTARGSGTDFSLSAHNSRDGLTELSPTIARCAAPVSLVERGIT